MDKRRFEREIASILKRTEVVWSRHHKNSTEALRWWFAYTEAEGMVETFNMREWAGLVLDGLSPVSSTMEELIDEIWGGTDEGDPDEVEGYLQSLKAFYTAED
jgi:hypothetical protein